MRPARRTPGNRTGGNGPIVWRDSSPLRMSWLWKTLSLFPATLIVLGVVADLVTPVEYRANAFFAAAPPLAASLLTVPAVLLVGMTALMANVLLGIEHDVGPLTHLVIASVSITVLTAVSLLLAHLRQQRQRQFETIRNVAETIQRAVLPMPPERVGPVSVAARYKAADAEAEIGGDLYAVQQTSYGVRFVVGDVRGKGLGAVRAVSVLLGAFREAADLAPSLLELVDRMEGTLYREGVRRAGESREEGFTTAVFGEVTTEGETLQLVNRGHPPPLLLRNGTASLVEEAEPALPLGMISLVEERGSVQRLPFPEGSTLLMFTDGVTEARNASDTFYDPVDRLAGRAGLSPNHLVDLVIGDVQRHTGGHVTDDLALLAVSRSRG